MPENQDERREYKRFDVHLEKLQVTVGFFGSEPTPGVVLDVSRGGMKVCLEHEIHKPVLARICLVRFVDDPQHRISAKAQYAKLLRMEAVGQYAIEFCRPLEVLPVAGREQDSESC